MPFTDPTEHCKLCYAFLNGEVCGRCIRSPSPFFRCLSPFSGSSTAISLIQSLLHPGGSFLADSLASLILMHMDRHHFPLGDIIIPASDAGSKKLAEALSRLLKIPFQDAIKEPSFFQHTPVLKRKTKPFLEERRLTFVSTGIRNFHTDFQEAMLLSEVFPESINALIFSRGI